MKRTAKPTKGTRRTRMVSSRPPACIPAGVYFPILICPLPGSSQAPNINKRYSFDSVIGHILEPDAQTVSLTIKWDTGETTQEPEHLVQEDITELIDA